MKRFIQVGAAVIGACACVGLAAGCGADSLSKSSTPPPTFTSATASAAATTAPPSAPANLTGPVGTTFTDSGTNDTSDTAFKYEVTLTRFDQRGTLTPYETLSRASDHAAVAVLSIKGDAGVSTDDVNAAALAIGTDGQEYQPSYNAVTEGTNFDSGDFTVTQGETVKGVVMFDLPSGVQVADLQWNPGGLGDQAPATWQLDS
jgi:hypothetical protein